jgi:two-component system cell cycle sensor histidine kinase/response regulator CckA
VIATGYIRISHLAHNLLKENYRRGLHLMTLRNYIIRYRTESLEAEDNKAVMKLPGGAETVLIVEDEESILKLSREMLELLGYKVLAVNETDQALRLAKEYDGNIDLLLTDVMMPGMNGKELSERIIAFKPGLKRLYMSGYTSDVITCQGILEEGVQFIHKPFSFKDLATKVRETLG